MRVGLGGGRGDKIKKRRKRKKKEERKKEEEKKKKKKKKGGGGEEQKKEEGNYLFIFTRKRLKKKKKKKKRLVRLLVESETEYRLKRLDRINKEILTVLQRRQTDTTTKMNRQRLQLLGMRVYF